MIDYIETLATFHSNVGVSAADACDYNTINWQGNTPIAKTTLEGEWLDIYKAEYIEAMSQQARADIVDGFQSLALGGSPGGYWYDSEEEDQLNLIGSASAGDDMNYSCRDTQGGTKTYRLHTHEQLLQVVRDGRDVKLGILQTFNTKKAAVLAAADKDAVDAITW